MLSAVDEMCIKRVVLCRHEFDDRVAMRVSSYVKLPLYPTSRREIGHGTYTIQPTTS